MNGQHILLLNEFREKAESLGVLVVSADSLMVAARAIAVWASEIDAAVAVVSSEIFAAAPELVSELESAGVRVEKPGAPDMVRDAPLGVSLAHMGVAETGSMLLAETTLADRSIGMLSLAQVILCPVSGLVPSLDEAAAAMRDLALAPGGSFATLVTGPSRTADIERVLTVGVQGPGKLMALFVDGV